MKTLFTLLTFITFTIVLQTSCTKDPIVEETPTDSIPNNTTSSWQTLINMDAAEYGWGTILHENLAVADNGTAYVAWAPSYSNDGQNVGYIRKWNGTTLEKIGTGIFAPYVDPTAYTAISLKIYNNVPYIAYLFGLDLFVVKFNGTDWEKLGGGAANLEYSAGGIDLEFKSNGTPVIAYAQIPTQFGNSGKLTVREFDGSTWQTLGNEAITDTTTSRIDLEISTTNDIYVGYLKYATNSSFPSPNIIEMQKYNGSTWTKYQIAGESLYWEDFQLALYGNVPVISYLDNNTSFFKIFNNGSWENISSLPSDAFSPEFAEYNGNIYLGFVKSLKTYFYKYNGTTWVEIPSTTKDSETAFFLGIKNGIPYTLLQTMKLEKFNGQW